MTQSRSSARRPLATPPASFEAGSMSAATSLAVADRRGLIGAGLGLATLLALPRFATAQSPAQPPIQAPEKPALKIAVGGKNLLYYLPLTVAEALGYFKDEGLDVEIVDFAGGSRALQAVVGGSADIVSGAFEHTVSMLAKGQPMQAFVLQGRAPQIVMAVSRKTMPAYRSVADLKGRKIGVTAPGSSTNVMANYVLAGAGLKPADVSFVGVGATNAAIAGIRQGQIDALSHLDPVITILERAGEIDIIADTRIVAEADKLFGGPMPAACLYAPTAFVAKNPRTVQALANAIVRADRWIQVAGPTEIVKVVPEGFLLNDRAVYIDAFLKSKGALSPDGTIPDGGAETAFRALASVDPKLGAMKLDLGSVYTNEFVRRAHQKFPKAA